MQANIRRSFTLTQTQDDLILYVAETFSISASEALRMICDCAIDMNPEIAKHLLENERRFKKLELKDLDQRIASAKNSRPDNPFRKLTAPKKRGKSDDLLKIENMSPEQIVSNYIEDAGKDSPTGVVAREHIRKAIATKPEILSMLPDDKRKMFESGSER